VRLHRAALLLVVLIAVALRVPGLSWGIPSPDFFLAKSPEGQNLVVLGPEPSPPGSHIYSFHPDEIFPVRAAARIALTGDPNPHFFNYGSLYIYLLAPLLRPFRPLMPLDTAHLIARLLTVTFSIATILLTYRIGKRLYNHRIGLLAACLIAVAPLHVVHSHFATVDVPLTFFTTLALAFSLSALQSQRLRHFLLAGAAAGLAASTKYSGLLSLVLPLAALLVPNKEFPLARRLGAALAVLAASGAAFLITCPFSILSPQDFLADVRFEFSHLAHGGTTAFLNTAPAPVYHLLNSLPNGLGPFLLVASLLGLGLALCRRQPGEWLLFLWTILSFAGASLSHEKFIRYMLPTLPCLALLASRLAILRRKAWRSLAFGLLGISALSAALISVAHLHYLLAPDARSTAAQWVLKRAAKGTLIGLPEFPWFFTPPVTPYNGGSRLSGEEFPAWNQRAANPLVIADWNPAPLAQNPPRFVILSDVEVKHRLRTGDLQARKFLDFLHSDYRLAAGFGSKPRIFGLPLVSKYPPPDWEYHDPIIRVYQRPGA